MIYSPLQTLLVTAIMKGVSPSMREALSLISSEMLQDLFSREIYSTVMELDRFNVQVSISSIEEQSSTLSFTDLAPYCKDIIFTENPMREARQIYNNFNDHLAVNDLTGIIDKIRSGKVFDREELSAQLNDLSSKMAPESDSKPIPFSQYTDSYMDILEAREMQEHSQYLDIGLEVDINKTDLIVLGGLPAMGKTALALFINDHVANQGKKTLIFSLEMDGNQIFERQVSAKSKVSSNDLRHPKEMEDYKFGLLGPALESLSEQQIYIDDSAALSMPVLAKKCRDFKNEHPDLALITIDYITLMKMPSASRRDLEVGELTRQMKVLSKELKTPILILSQLNRDAAKAQREPMNSDLRDSGAIEQDADKIIFPYRDEVNNPESPNKGLAKILKTKVRDGNTGYVILKFEHGNFLQADIENWSDVESIKKPERSKF